MITVTQTTTTITTTEAGPPGEDHEAFLVLLKEARRAHRTFVTAGWVYSQGKLYAALQPFENVKA